MGAISEKYGKFDESFQQKLEKTDTLQSGIKTLRKHVRMYINAFHKKSSRTCEVKYFPEDLLINKSGSKICILAISSAWLG